jgi:uncharacterized protein involved in outer membrane biogenesis
VGVAARFGLGMLVRSPEFRALVEDTARDTLGVEVSIGAPIRPAFSLIPGVDLESLHFRSPKDADWWLDAKVQAVSLRIRVLPLLWGTLDTTVLELEGVELAYDPPPDSGSSDSVSLDVAALLERLPKVTRLENTRIRQGRKGAVELEISTERAVLRGCGDPFEFDGELDGIPLGVAATLECEGPRTLRLEDLDATTRGVPLSGELVIALGSPGRPRLSGTLRAARLDLAELADAPEGDTSDAAGLVSWLDVALPYDRLDGLDLDLTALVADLKAGDHAFSDVSVQAKLQDAQLELSLRAGVLEGKASLVLRAQGGSTGSLAVSLQLEELPLGRLLGKPGVTGTFGVDLELAGVGATPRAVLASGNGSLDYELGEAEFPEALLGPLGKDVVGILTSQFKSHRATHFECVVLRSEFHDGLGIPTVVVADTPELTLSGGGVIDLRELSADLLLRPHPKHTQIVPANAPLRIYGPLDDLSAGLDTAELARDAGRFLSGGLLDPRRVAAIFVDLGSGSAHPCDIDLEKVTDARSASLLQTTGRAARGVTGWILGIFGERDDL